MNRLPSPSFVVLAVVLVVALGAALLYASRPAFSNLGGGQPDPFTVGTAILVVGYLMFPVLALIAAVLLLVAMLLVLAQLIESRREGARLHREPRTETARR